MHPESTADSGRKADLRWPWHPSLYAYFREDFMRTILPTLFVLCGSLPLFAQVTPPKGEGVTVDLFASEPDIVTPVGITVDAKGRLLVIESHTHFRPKDYKGPPTDRIRVLEDTNGDGKADKFTTFWEGSTATMNLATHPDGSIYVTARNELFRLRDTNGDGVADDKLVLVKLDTKGDYPHNGLTGLTIHKDGTIWFGIGENLGEPYKMIAADGTVFSDDTTNGGLIFHCDALGKGLKQYARGFWNPFGLCFDRDGNLFMVDNDPDGRPPCRLIHVVPGGDYGYQYRYGRSGQHPLSAWEGELPGTLPPIIGTGEAPCQVLPCGMDRLLVASWGDHRIEAYDLTESGASYKAIMRPVVTGGDNFRPVGMAFAPDGALFVSDWVLADYNLHGKGRVWRVKGFRPEAGLRSSPDVAGKPGPAAKRAQTLRGTTDITALFDALRDPDPFISQAAQYGLSQRIDLLTSWASLESSQRIGLLAALRYSGNTAYLDKSLQDESPDVRLMAVRWIGDEKLVGYKPGIEKAIREPVLTPRLFAAYLATLERFEDKGLFVGKPGTTIEQYLLPRLNDPASTPRVKTMALRMLRPDHEQLKLETVRQFVGGSEVALRQEAVRWLAAGTKPARLEMLAEVAGNDKLESNLRADAVVGLASDAGKQKGLLLALALEDDAIVSDEALRALRGVELTAEEKEKLGQMAARRPEARPLVARLTGGTVAGVRPPVEDVAGWVKLTEGEGDGAAGRRIFFHPSGPGCFRCHTVEGRGAAVGPDLTTLAKKENLRHWLLESLLYPGKEVGPIYTPYLLTLADGTSRVGLLTKINGGEQTFTDPTGQSFTVKTATLRGQAPMPGSIMPAGLAETMTDRELRDLLAYLMSKR